MLFIWIVHTISWRLANVDASGDYSREHRLVDERTSNEQRAHQL